MKKLLALLLCGAFLALGTACTPKDVEPSSKNTSAPAGNAGETTAEPTPATTKSALVPPLTASDDTTPEGDKYMNKINATITMENGGVIKLELYPDLAPQSVRNFCYLARKGFYDGLTFHRIIPGFMIQGGDPDGDGTGGPGYCIKGEFAVNGFENDLSHTRGVISWARKSRPNDSAGSQFFIMHADYTRLDGSYAAFGRVIEGIEVVDEIAAVETGMNDRPVTPVVIKSITIEGPELPEPDKIM
jgi:peptidyl-prolyl cis-trans isomerase B (cyclophilin B)